MIRSITALAIRFFKENKFIALSSIVGIMFSISLIITMVVFLSNAKQGLIDETQEKYGMMDVEVGYHPDQAEVMDAELIETLIANQDVLQHSSILHKNYIIDELGESLPTIGVENDALAKSRYHFHKDLALNEVILNEGFAAVLDVQIGDSVSIESENFKLKEILPDVQIDEVVDNRIILSKVKSQQLTYKNTGQFYEADFIMMKLVGGADVYELSNEFQQSSSELKVNVPLEDPHLKSNLDLFYQFMIVLSILVLIITSLFIISNFEVFLYKYKNQLAIMRSIGATTEQVFKIVWIQCSLLNIFGALFAYLLTLSSFQLIQTSFEALFSLPAGHMTFNYGLALAVTLISMGIIQLFMLIPAYRSSKLLPLTIMQDNEKTDFSHQVLRKKVGGGLLATSLIFIVAGAIFDSVRVLLLPGALFLVLGVLLLLPLYLSAMIAYLLPTVRRIFGNTSFVALKNIIPQVKKNTFIVLMVSSMMIIVVFGSAFLKTIQQSDENYIKLQYPTDIIITSHIVENSSVDAAKLKAEMGELSTVESVSTISTSYPFQIDGGKDVDVAFGDLAEMEVQGILPTNLTKIENAVIVQEDIAVENGLAVGDKVDLVNYIVNESTGIIDDSEGGTVIVAGIVEELPNFGTLLMDWENNVFNTEIFDFNKAFIASGNSENTLLQIGKLKETYPEIEVSSFEQSLAQSKEMFTQRWSIFIVVLIVILFSVMLGVMNTLVNNVHSKRKEFAVLRAIHLDKKGIIQVILTQVTTYILIGIVLGISLGMLLTYVVGLVDSVPIYFDYLLIAAMSGAVFVIAYIIFVPFANKIGKLPIFTELTQDNK